MVTPPPSTVKESPSPNAPSQVFRKKSAPAHYFPTFIPSSSRQEVPPSNPTSVVRVLSSSSVKSAQSVDRLRESSSLRFFVFKVVTSVPSTHPPSANPSNSPTQTPPENTASSHTASAARSPPPAPQSSPDYAPSNSAAPPRTPPHGSPPPPPA